MHGRFRLMSAEPRATRLRGTDGVVLAVEIVHAPAGHRLPATIRGGGAAAPMPNIARPIAFLYSPVRRTRRKSSRPHRGLAPPWTRRRMTGPPRSTALPATASMHGPPDGSPARTPIGRRNERFRFPTFFVCPSPKQRLFEFPVERSKNATAQM